MIEKIEFDGKLLALLVRDSFRKLGVHFVTPDELSQQLAFIHHPVGKKIEPHVHNPIAREVLYTQEVLLIKRGKLRVDFYDGDRNYLHSKILEQGDTLLLVAGGHGFEVLEEVEMIEVKQGPYAGEADMTRFRSVPPQPVEHKEILR